MRREEIRTRFQDSNPFFANMINNGAVEVCLKEDVDKYIDEVESRNKELEKKYCELEQKFKTNLCETRSDLGKLVYQVERINGHVQKTLTDLDKE